MQTELHQTVFAGILVVSDVTSSLYLKHSWDCCEKFKLSRKILTVNAAMQWCRQCCACGGVIIPCTSLVLCITASRAVWMGAFSNPPMEARFTLRFASFNPQIADPVNSCVILHLNKINNQHWYSVLNLWISRWRDGWIHLSIFWAQALNIFSGAEQKTKEL